MNKTINCLLLDLVHRSDRDPEPCLACEQLVDNDSPHTIARIAGAPDDEASILGLLHPPCELQYVQMPNSPRFRSAALGGGASKGKNRFNENDVARTLGGYDWDTWKMEAVSKGVPADLAHLGQALMREAYEEAWSKERQAECGWRDYGASMLELAISNPNAARERWNYLLETAGRHDKTN